MSKHTRTLIIIPARMGSNRLPGKPLLMAGGKTLLEHVYGQARHAGGRVIVTSPDPEILQLCESLSIEFVRSGESSTGTHRCADVASRMSAIANYDVIVNWQVDEPMVDPRDVDRISRFAHKSGKITTIVADAPREFSSHSQVKVRVAPSRSSAAFQCLDFSRAIIPAAMLHVGIYAFPSETLDRLGRIPPTKLSVLESLEQLAWVESGCEILAIPVNRAPLSVNDSEDLQKWQKRFRRPTSKSAREASSFQG